MEEQVLPRLHSCSSSLGTTLEQKQQKIVASSPKNNGGINPEYVSKSYPTKEKTLKGMLVKGVKVRLFNNQRLCFAEMLTKSGSLKIQFYLSG
jgi:hypothetical protein